MRNKRTPDDSRKTRGELLSLQQTLYASKNPTRYWLHNRRKEWIEQAIRATSGSGTGTALEIGPGSGVYLPLLSECFARVVATDIEHEFIENSALFGSDYARVECVRDDITLTSLPHESFDLVLCTEVVEHIANIEAALLNMRAILKRDGVLILSTPHRYSPLEMLSKVAYLPGIIDVVRMIYREPILDAGHINLMTGAALRKLLQRTGFTIVRREAFGFYLPFVAEFLGTAGLKLEQRLERLLKGTRLEELLWTQAYILTSKQDLS